jgi:tRNA (guanine-N7-)-methyltransferase
MGRPLRDGRKRALAETLPSLALDLASLGTCAGPAALEVGFGSGEHLAAQAHAHPDTLFIGCEPFLNGVAALAKTAAQTGLANLRIHHGDARDVLERLPGGSLDAVFVLFPDPWPKARHARRRFVNAGTLAAIAQCLKPGGMLRIASDIPAYVRWTLEQVAAANRAAPSFRWTARAPGDWRMRPADWPPTRYEGKALLAGRAPAYLAFERL